MMLGLREDVAPEKDIGLGDARVVKCRLTKTEGYFIPLTLWFIFILSGRPRICGKPPCLCCWGMTPAIPGWTFYAQICSKTIWHNREWGTMGTGLVMLHPAMTELKTKWFSHQKMASMGMFAKFGTGRGDWLWPGSHKASSHLQQSFYPGAREGAPMMPSPELRCLSEAEKSEARKCLGSPKDGCFLTGKNADNPKRWTGREAKLKCESGCNSILTAQVQMCQKVDHGPVVVDDDELKKVLFLNLIHHLQVIPVTCKICNFCSSKKKIMPTGSFELKVQIQWVATPIAPFWTFIHCYVCFPEFVLSRMEFHDVPSLSYMAHEKDRESMPTFPRCWRCSNCEASHNLKVWSNGTNGNVYIYIHIVLFNSCSVRPRNVLTHQ